MASKPFLVKVPDQMLSLWRQAAEKRGVTVAHLIRDSVNRAIEEDTRNKAP